MAEQYIAKQKLKPNAQPFVPSNVKSNSDNISDKERTFSGRREFNSISTP